LLQIVVVILHNTFYEKPAHQIHNESCKTCCRPKSPHCKWKKNAQSLLLWYVVNLLDSKTYNKLNNIVTCRNVVELL